MPRTHYSGRFEPDLIPSFNSSILSRSDVSQYRSIAGPKAAAYHAWARLFIVNSTANQYDAEEQALANCNADPTRKGVNGPCFLYSTGDQVLLPQRLTKPRPLPKTISELFAYLQLPTYTIYGTEAAHKAIAFAPENGRLFNWANAPSAEMAAQWSLEGCQLTYRVSCVLLASDDKLITTKDPWQEARHDMPRVHYNGPYKPENVPLFSGTENDLNAYVSLPAPKAMVVRPAGDRLRVATGATEVQAQAKALAACNDDLNSFPCFVYAVNDRVIIGDRLTEPLK
jgi:hypothetical protein